MIIVNMCSHKKFKLITSIPIALSILLSFNYFLDCSHYSSNEPNRTEPNHTIFWCHVQHDRTLKIHIVRLHHCPKAERLTDLMWGTDGDERFIFSDEKQRIHINFMLRLATKCMGTYKYVAADLAFPLPFETEHLIFGPTFCQTKQPCFLFSLWHTSCEWFKSSIFSKDWNNATANEYVMWCSWPKSCSVSVLAVRCIPFSLTQFHR